MKKAILISFFLFVFVYDYGQNVQDQYVSLYGQTIEGKVENYKEWSKNPTEAEFKDTHNNSVKLTPESCKSFTAGGDVYVSYIGTRIVNSDNAMNTEGIINDIAEKDSVKVFLRQIYQHANYVLYELKDKIRTNFYFSDNGNITELEYFESISSNNAVTPHEGYKGFLNQEFNNKDISNLQVRLQKLSYKENDLVDFFAYVFNDKAQAKERKRDRYPAEIFIGVDGNANSATLSNIQIGKTDFKQTSFAPSFEIGSRIYSQRNFGKLFFQPSVDIMRLSSEFKNHDFTLKATVLNINLGAGYMFVKKNSFAVYGVANATFSVPFGVRTTWGYGNVDVPANAVNQRLTAHLEAGVIIVSSISINASAYLPIKYPFDAYPSEAYKVNTISFGIKYAFALGHEKR